MEEYKLSLNSVANGKGLATYYNKNIFQHTEDIKMDLMQLSKFSSRDFEVISVYRSNNGNEKQLVEAINSILPIGKPAIICGDINICFAENRKNTVSVNLKKLGFKQIVREATHIEGGHIDHIYVRGLKIMDMELYSPYYTAKDHDALFLSVGLQH